DALKAGASMALVSDAGTPLVSDPGWKLVHEALAEDIPVRPVPGASALLAGLVASGLPSDQFMFAGFPPPKQAARRRFLEDVAAVNATLVFYESGPRLATSLADMALVLGADRDAAVARELTKLFEETRRASLIELAELYREQGAPKGEIVVLVGPPKPPERPDDATLDAALLRALANAPVKAAAAEIAAAFGLPKRDVYQRALALKDATDG
ncbi:MAG: ribosomal RNA small subunit methyltransferase I, partial [Pseudomonadota bacterium]